jgi:NADPH2:quinone reductase
LVHTAAASSLGQMLNRVCLQAGIPLVNVVRRPEQASLLIAQGASFVCDTSSETFVEDLGNNVAATRATLAFDALGGGVLAGQILTAMERACGADATEFSRYGSTIHKQIYFYGGLDPRPTLLDRSYGMAWSVGGWLIFDKLKRMDPGIFEAMKVRIASELESTFSTKFRAEISLTDLMRKEYFEAFAQRSTGEKYLVNPKLSLE